MAGVLQTVYVHKGPDGRAETHCFGPGDDVPEWAARQMGAHCFEDGDHPYPEKAAGKHAVDGPPPKSGKGSGAGAWEAYAESKDVEIEEGASRDEIIAACEAADVPTE